MDSLLKKIQNVTQAVVDLPATPIKPVEGGMYDTAVFFGPWKMERIFGADSQIKSGVRPLVGLILKSTPSSENGSLNAQPPTAAEQKIAWLVVSLEAKIEAAENRINELKRINSAGNQLYINLLNEKIKVWEAQLDILGGSPSRELVNQLGKTIDPKIASKKEKIAAAKKELHDLHKEETYDHWADNSEKRAFLETRIREWELSLKALQKLKKHL